jgi:molecular chaperone GrpE
MAEKKGKATGKAQKAREDKSEEIVGELRRQVEELNNRLAEQTDLAQSYKNQMMRTQADFENYQKRIEKEKSELVDRANEALMCALLETLDGFDKALASLGERNSQDLEGVRMLHDALVSALASNGLERITATSCKFDPRMHEAVMQVQADGHEEGAVVEEIQPGYAFRGRVVRPAKVSVARPPDQDEQDDKKEE